MSMNMPLKRLQLPSTIILTPFVITNVIRKFSNDTISQIIDCLIEELDLRLGDSDFEVEAVESSAYDF